ncbi:hypothetical protein O6H91_06G068400 [Diphasiastrum complanatum]|uniref:Uncharacterized protein n=1 Tax=Diphasiastrum complanatum TaxID=34168 RepID=A0ACC2DEV3_DIPCM|nr:hypothetical protein O6H91_06G068400 [Diphasiastrum complanatum]
MTMATKRTNESKESKTFQKLNSEMLLETFESNFAVTLDELLPKFDAGFMNLQWLKQAVATVLASHTSMKALAPEIRIPLSRKDEKWMRDFLDESAKFLDICNVIRTGTAQVERNHMHIKRLLLILDSKQDTINESALWSARKALIDVLALFENVEGESDSQSRLSFDKIAASEVLQSVSDKLIPPKCNGASRANDFPSAAYGANLITVLILGVLLAALPCNDAGTINVSNVSNRYMWSQSLLSIHEGVREEVDRKKKNNETAWRLSELEAIHTCLRLLLDLIDTLISERRFSILTHLQDEEVQEAVRKLRELSEHLERGLVGLELQIRELFRYLISNRNAVLDSFAKAD